MILGIECTAHTFGVGVFDNKKILSNERDMYSTASGGMIPNEVAEHHKKVAPNVYKKSLATAGITESQLTKIAYSAGPGIPPALWEGYRFAEKLSKKLKIPLIPVNHCIAHIEIGKFATGFKDPLTVYVSGGNTQIIGFENKRYRIFGETLDIGIGNAYDKFARALDLQMPGGPKISQMAAQGKNYIELPYTVKGMDLVFAGLVTKACELATLNKRSLLAPQNAKHSEAKADKNDLCFSFQETALAMLVEVTERALAHSGKKELILTGGVAQDKRLQEMLKAMCDERCVKFSVPEKQYCGDNGAQIAVTGSLMENFVKKENWKTNPHWRTDEVEIFW